MSQTEVRKNQSCTHNNLETPLKYLIPFNPQIFQEQSAIYMHQIKEKPGFQMLSNTCPLEYTHSRQKLLKYLQGTKTKKLHCTFQTQTKWSCTWQIYIHSARTLWFFWDSIYKASPPRNADDSVCSPAEHHIPERMDRSGSAAQSNATSHVLETRPQWFEFRAPCTIDECCNTHGAPIQKENGPLRSISVSMDR